MEVVLTKGSFKQVKEKQPTKSPSPILKMGWFTNFQNQKKKNELFPVVGKGSVSNPGIFMK